MHVQGIPSLDETVAPEHEKVATGGESDSNRIAAALAELVKFAPS